ncbi:MAG: arabinofuranosidase [Gordonia sp. (in: high G+C Gram-positive bacteria)]|uniref:arabinofuranosidase n=1 Tax=Gordonia sp. (in: high G+C Gram-positive bacteria) TaxID=84139 RepID=UPI0039E40504
MPAAGLAVVVGLVFSGTSPSAAAPERWRYTMVGFSNVSAQNMDVYESNDGTDYTLVKASAYRPPTGAVRDPSLLAHVDGRYYIAYTTGEGTNIGFASSPDRLVWTHLRNHPVPFCCAFLPGTGDGRGPVNPLGINGSAGFRDGPSLSPFTTKAWAPDWVVDDDGRVHVVFSMSTGGGFVPYLMTALNRSLTAWTRPVPVAGLPADRIDTTIVEADGRYHAFVKNEHKKVLEHAVADAVGGPYSFVAPGDWGTYVEGPALVRLPNDHWRLYFDAYREKRYFYSDSADGMQTWSPRRELPGHSGTVRHFGVVREAG